MTTLPSHPVDLLSQVSSSRESLYDLADLAPHGCLPLIELTTQLTHLEILLVRPTTTAAVAQRSVADATVAALRVLDDLAREGPGGGCDADDRGWLQRLHRREEVVRRRMLMGVGAFVAARSSFT